MPVFTAILTPGAGTRCVSRTRLYDPHRLTTPHLEIRADYDASTIVVYQAYRPEIAQAAVAAQRFVAPFSVSRMTWIKPSFLWMMERSGWATKEGQEHVLGVRITRAGWEEALASARLSEQGSGDAPVVVQWDPERTVRGAKLGHRSIQVGLGRGMVQRYVSEWTVEIRDLTPLVGKLRRFREEGEWSLVAHWLPPERPYPVPPLIARRLGMPDAPPMIDQSFLMPIVDVIAGLARGTVVTGRIERGTVRVGDEVEIVGSGATTKAAVLGIETSRKLVDVGRAADEVGLLLDKRGRVDMERGQVLAKPGSIGSHRRLAATLHMRTKEEGGRDTPFRDGYRPSFWFWTCNPGGTVTLPREQHEVKPGDDATVQIDLLVSVACEVGLHFTVRESGEIVGEGVVTQLLD